MSDHVKNIRFRSRSRRRAWLTAVLGCGFFLSGAFPLQSNSNNLRLYGPGGHQKYESGGIPETGVRGEPTVNEWAQSGGLRLEVDQTVFAPGESLPVRFVIRNRGSRVIHLFPAREIIQSFSARIQTKKGRRVSLRPVPLGQKASDGSGLIAPNSGPGGQAEQGVTGGYHGRHVAGYPLGRSSPYSTREVALYPGEAFTRVVDLSHYYDLKPGETYFIRGVFFPNRAQNPEVFAQSENTLRVRIREGRPRLTDSLASAPPAARATRMNQGLAPYETVFLFLTAELKKNWQDYLKYVKLDDYIRSFDRFARRYIQAGQVDRGLILAEFKKYLTRRRSHPLKRYRIRETTETVPGRSAKVVVDIERQNNRYPMKYRYTYFLENESPGSFWKITYLSVKVLPP